MQTIVVDSGMLPKQITVTAESTVRLVHGAILPVHSWPSRVWDGRRSSYSTSRVCVGCFMLIIAVNLLRPGARDSNGFIEDIVAPIPADISNVLVLASFLAPCAGPHAGGAIFGGMMLCLALDCLRKEGLRAVGVGLMAAFAASSCCCFSASIFAFSLPRASMSCVFSCEISLWASLSCSLSFLFSGAAPCTAFMVACCCSRSTFTRASRARNSPVTSASCIAAASSCICIWLAKSDSFSFSWRVSCSTC
mmetsp:Transcript_70274/g.168394  ORF Transcript_70274/g.168394 Transcript_70274/m.168394 type:complete len:250 (-) Transcript_70274:3964-4713(-)